MASQDQFAGKRDLFGSQDASRSSDSDVLRPRDASRFANADESNQDLGSSSAPKKSPFLDYVIKYQYSRHQMIDLFKPSDAPEHFKAPDDMISLESLLPVASQPLDQLEVEAREGKPRPRISVRGGRGGYAGPRDAPPRDASGSGARPARPPGLPTPEEGESEEDEITWMYIDPQGNQQGPWSGTEMNDWHEAGYFSNHLMVKRIVNGNTSSGVFSPLQELLAQNPAPFIPQPKPKPTPQQQPKAAAEPTPGQAKTPAAGADPAARPAAAAPTPAVSAGSSGASSAAAASGADVFWDRFGSAGAPAARTAPTVSGAAATPNLPAAAKPATSQAAAAAAPRPPAATPTPAPAPAPVPAVAPTPAQPKPSEVSKLGLYQSGGHSPVPQVQPAAPQSVPAVSAAAAAARPGVASQQQPPLPQQQQQGLLQQMLQQQQPATAQTPYAPPASQPGPQAAVPQRKQGVFVLDGSGQFVPVPLAQINPVPFYGNGGGAPPAAPFLPGQVPPAALPPHLGADPLAQFASQAQPVLAPQLQARAGAPWQMPVAGSVLPDQVPTDPNLYPLARPQAVPHQQQQPQPPAAADPLMELLSMAAAVPIGSVQRDPSLSPTVPRAPTSSAASASAAPAGAPSPTSASESSSYQDDQFEYFPGEEAGPWQVTPKKGGKQPQGKGTTKTPDSQKKGVKPDPQPAQQQPQPKKPETTAAATPAVSAASKEAPQDELRPAHGPTLGHFLPPQPQQYQPPPVAVAPAIPVMSLKQIQQEELRRKEEEMQQHQQYLQQLKLQEAKQNAARQQQQQLQQQQQAAAAAAAAAAQPPGPMSLRDIQQEELRAKEAQLRRQQQEQALAAQSAGPKQPAKKKGKGKSEQDWEDEPQAAPAAAMKALSLREIQEEEMRKQQQLKQQQAAAQAALQQAHPQPRRVVGKWGATETKPLSLKEIQELELKQKANSPPPASSDASAVFSAAAKSSDLPLWSNMPVGGQPSPPPMSEPVAYQQQSKSKAAPVSETTAARTPSPSLPVPQTPPPAQSSQPASGGSGKKEKGNARNNSNAKKAAVQEPPSVWGVSASSGPSLRDIQAQEKKRPAAPASPAPAPAPAPAASDDDLFWGAEPEPPKPTAKTRSPAPTADQDFPSLGGGSSSNAKKVTQPAEKVRSAAVPRGPAQPPAAASAPQQAPLKGGAWEKPAKADDKPSPPKNAAKAAKKGQSVRLDTLLNFKVQSQRVNQGEIETGE